MTEEKRAAIEDALKSPRFIDIASNAKHLSVIEDALQQEFGRRHIDANVFSVHALPDAAGGGFEAKIDLRDNGPIARFPFLTD